MGLFVDLFLLRPLIIKHFCLW